MTETLAANPLCNPLCRVCHYKKLDYSAQVERKNLWARECLGGWSVLQAIRSAPAEERIGYRTKSWMRSFFQEGDISFGMFRAIQVEGCWEKEFISWDTCPLHARSIQSMIGKLKQVLVAKAAKSENRADFLKESLAGIWVGSPHLVMVSRSEDPTLLQDLNWSSILVPPFDRVWFHCNTQVGRKAFGHHPILPLFGAAQDTPEVVHPIRAFRQVARTLLLEARAQAVEALLAPQPHLVLDLYCGTGDLSLSLPPEVGWLGIEFSKDAVKFAQLHRPGSTALHQAYVGGVEQRLQDPKVLARIRSVDSYSIFVNPPRSGLTEEARGCLMALIAEKPALTIAYLSCSASSLARDLAAFETVGLRVSQLQPYDFFPQTEHFETLAVIVPTQRS